MMNLIKKILEKWACKHEWELFKDVSMEERSMLGTRLTYHIWHFICKRCGEFKQVRSS